MKKVYYKYFGIVEVNFRYRAAVCFHKRCSWYQFIYKCRPTVGELAEIRRQESHIIDPCCEVRQEHDDGPHGHEVSSRGQHDPVMHESPHVPEEQPHGSGHQVVRHTNPGYLRGGQLKPPLYGGHVHVDDPVHHKSWKKKRRDTYIYRANPVVYTYLFNTVHIYVLMTH